MQLARPVAGLGDLGLHRVDLDPLGRDRLLGTIDRGGVTAGARGAQFVLGAAQVVAHVEHHGGESVGFDRERVAAHLDLLLDRHQLVDEVVGGRGDGDLARLRRRRERAAPVAFGDSGARALEVEVVIVRQQHRHPEGLADQRRIRHHHLAQIVARAGAEQPEQQLAIGPRGRLGEQRRQGTPHDRGVVARPERRGVALGLRVDVGLAHGDLEHRRGLAEGRGPLDQDVAEQRDQKRRGDDERGDTVGAEAPFAGIPLANAGTGRVRGRVETP